MVCERIMDLKMLSELTIGEDIISKLPDHVLSHILSRLKTKDAVKTCVLSSRWKDVWTLIYNLHFEYWHFRGSINFENFVDKVLGRCQSQEIQNFRIALDFSNDTELLSRFPLWISFAIEHKVQNLEINVNYDSEIGNWLPIRLPQSILTCKTLVKLKLDSGNCDFDFDIHDSVACFPSLKILCVELLCSKSNLMEKLFSSCPVLEELTIREDLEDTENVLTFDITVRTLKILNIYLISDWNMSERVSIHKFVVRAPNLEQLYIEDDSLACFVMDETPFISNAYLVGCFSMRSFFEPSKNEANRAMELLRAIKNTTFLSLSKGIMGVLFLAFDGNLPTFPNLIRLDVGIDAHFGWKLLPHFLNNSPNLEVLILKKEENDLPMDRFFYFESENVPSCLLLHVKEIEVSMMGDHDELEVIRYLLKNSKVLKRFLVVFNRFDSDCEGFQLTEELEQYLQYQISRFPRGSNLHEVEFC
ncbi:hypothetical protein ACOSQ3_006146 [Xanthoceras sorbifolium]